MTNPPVVKGRPLGLFQATSVSVDPASGSVGVMSTGRSRSCATLLFTMGVPPATVQRILRHSSITVTTGTYVEVIEAVQRDALDSMGTLFAHVGDDPQRELSSKLSSNGSE